MAATWMAHLGISTRIVDKRDDQVRVGQADGLHPRTLEILDSFGLADPFLKEGNALIEAQFWVCGYLLSYLWVAVLKIIRFPLAKEALNELEAVPSIFLASHHFSPSLYLREGSKLSLWNI